VSLIQKSRLYVSLAIPNGENMKLLATSIIMLFFGLSLFADVDIPGWNAFLQPEGRYRVTFIGITPGEKRAFFRVVDEIDNSEPFAILPFRVVAIDLSDEYGKLAYNLILAAKMSDSKIARMRYEEGASANGVAKLIEVELP